MRDMDNCFNGIRNLFDGCALKRITQYIGFSCTSTGFAWNTNTPRFNYDYTSVCEGIKHWRNLFFVFACWAAKASGDLCRGAKLVMSLFIHLYIRVSSKFSCIVVYCY